MGQTISGSIGHFWNESYGQIYPNLKRLAADGFVSSRAEKQKGKPDRRIYSITKNGRQRLASWLTVPPQAEIPRNELLLKLFFGAQLSPEISIGYIERMVESEQTSLQLIKRAAGEIARNQQYPDAPYWKMAARFGQFELEAHLRWAAETLAELRKIARKPGSLENVRKEKTHAAR